MQHCVRRKPNCHCKLMASKSQRFHLRVLPLWTLHTDQGAVSIAVPQRFDAPDPARLMSGRSPQPASVVSLVLSASTAWLRNTPTDNTYIHLKQFLNLTLTCAMHRILIPLTVLKCLDSFIRTAGTIRDERCEITTSESQCITHKHLFIFTPPVCLCLKLEKKDKIDFFYAPHGDTLFSPTSFPLYRLCS